MLPPFKLNIIAGKIKGISGAFIETGEVLTEVTKKTKPFFTSMHLLAEQIIPTIGQALTDSFAAIAGLFTLSKR